MNPNLESRRSGRLRGDDPAFQTEDLSVLHRKKSYNADKSPLLATQPIDNTTSELEKLENELEITTELNNKKTQLEINETKKNRTMPISLLYWQLNRSITQPRNLKN